MCIVIREDGFKMKIIFFWGCRIGGYCEGGEFFGWIRL